MTHCAECVIEMFCWYFNCILIAEIFPVSFAVPFRVRFRRTATSTQSQARFQLKCRHFETKDKSNCFQVYFVGSTTKNGG